MNTAAFMPLIHRPRSVAPANENLASPLSWLVDLNEPADRDLAARQRRGGLPARGKPTTPAPFPAQAPGTGLVLLICITLGAFGVTHLVPGYPRRPQPGAGAPQDPAAVPAFLHQYSSTRPLPVPVPLYLRPVRPATWYQRSSPTVRSSDLKSTCPPTRTRAVFAHRDLADQRVARGHRRRRLRTGGRTHHPGISLAGYRADLLIALVAFNLLFFFGSAG